MPEKVEKCVRSVMEDDPDMDEDRAWAICKSQEQEGNLEDGADLATGCPDGQVDIGGECVAYESVDAPASLLAQPRVMASASPLDTQPIEREELEDNKVKYASLKLISGGIWTDSNSETPTLYDDRTFENTDPEYPSEYDGPPVNIAHDLHKDGPNAGEPHEASIGGYIDPDSLATDGEALFGDVILDRDTDAGAFADTNLKSALENNGTAGFSPSVELMPTEMEDADHSQAEEYVKAAELTGLGLVRDPASEVVDLAHETRNRSVALSASGEAIKTLTRQDDDMTDEPIDEIRAEILSRNLQMEDMEDDVEAIADELDIPADEVWEVLDPLLDMDDGEEGEADEEEEPPEMEDGEGDEDEEDDEDEQEMEDGDGPSEDLDALQEMVTSLASRLEDVEDALSDKLSADDAKAELAAADTVESLEEDKRELQQRVEELENVGADAKTLADNDGDEIDFSEADSGYDYDPATGSMSR